MRVRLMTACVAIAALLAIAALALGRTAAAPLGIVKASLTQDGPQLIWSITLDHPFAPADLSADHRSLCLLVERARDGSVAGALCVGGDRAGRAALSYAHVSAHGRGAPSLVPATIARAGSDELSTTFAASSIGLSYTAVRWQVADGFSAGACRPALTHKAAGCVTLFPVAPTLLTLHTPVPVGCVPSGAPFVSSGTTAGKEIALTFDDGPWYDTPQFLSLLEREHVVATFFQIGDQVSEYGGPGGSVERRMLGDGDMIGDHTWNHQDVAGAGAFAASEIGRAAAAIKQATGGFQPCLFRAPYGDVSSALISEVRSMGFTTIQWDIDPRDWSLPGTSEIVDNVLANARPGGIVEMHDGGGNRSETLAALPTIISTLRSRGYTFVTITQLLGQKVIYK